MNNQKEIIFIKDLGMMFPKESSKRKSRYALYKCFCGEEFEAIVQNVNRFQVKSCGCLRGNNHGARNHRLYRVWNNMIQRCTNPKNTFYKNYGERGIKVCDEWLDINNFIKDMYPSFIEGLTLDRVDNNLEYSKYNCRWANNNVQARNTRKIMCTNTSGYRGICFNKKNKKWIATIQVNSKKIYIGSFNTSIEAAKAYDNYIICNNLEHTKNF